MTLIEERDFFSREAERLQDENINLRAALAAYGEPIALATTTSIEWLRNPADYIGSDGRVMLFAKTAKGGK